MAEGLLRLRFGEQYEAHSAGTAPSRVNPWAIHAMKELGCDISGQVSKHVDEYRDETFDVVVTTCDSAQETCPIFPGAGETIHHSFEDPAAAAGSNERILAVFRRVRDQIDRWIQETFDPAAETE
jgi:arsenate reductase